MTSQSFPSLPRHRLDALEAYIKNLDKLTVFTDKEVLQKQYDKLSEENTALKSMFSENMLKAMIDERVKEITGKK